MSASWRAALALTLVYLGWATTSSIVEKWTGRQVVLQGAAWAPIAQPPTEDQVTAAEAAAPPPPAPLPAGPAPSQPPPAPACDQVDAIRATIRQLESGGDYQAQAPGSSASGAYQFLDTTWAGYGGYRRAADAPPHIQDAKATEHIAEAMGGTGDVSRVPVIWYIGHVPRTDAEWDTVPAPWAGNRLTPREYQRRWMGIYQRFAQCGSPD